MRFSRSQFLQILMMVLQLQKLLSQTNLLPSGKKKTPLFNSVHKYWGTQMKILLKGFMVQFFFRKQAFVIWHFLIQIQV